MQVQLPQRSQNFLGGYHCDRTNNDQKQAAVDLKHEGRDDYFMDIDRMVNEGLGGGNVTLQNGLIDESTTDTIDQETR